MRFNYKGLGVLGILSLLVLTDIPLLSSIEDANAIFGVRRRTAVIAYSAGATRAASASAATYQQQAPTQTIQSASAAPTTPVGTVVETLPAGCVPVTVGNVQYQDCAGTFYRAAFQGNTLVYVVTEKPV